MSANFEQSLKEFSEKHGAVLLGMHKELQEMQASVDSAMQEASRAETLNARVERDLTKGLNDIKASARAQLDHVNVKLNEAQILYEKALALLIEHKQREEAHHRNMLTLAKAMLVVGGVLVVLFGVMLWVR